LAEQIEGRTVLARWVPLHRLAGARQTIIVLIAPKAASALVTLIGAKKWPSAATTMSRSSARRIAPMARKTPLLRTVRATRMSILA
jgi:hypothetical protein